MTHVKIVGLGVNKLSDRSKRMVFWVYEPGIKGYWLYYPE
jgi:hypothetical protein